MNRRETEQVRQLAREKTLYRYSSALERGDFEVVAAVLRGAEEDSALERMLLEVNEVYQAEMEGQPARAARAQRTTRETSRQHPLAWLLGWTRNHRKGEQRIKSRMSNRYGIRNGLIAGSALLAVALTFAIGFAIYTSPGRSGGTVAPIAEATVVVEATVVAPVELPPPVEDIGVGGGGPDSYFLPIQPSLPIPTPMPAPYHFLYGARAAVWSSWQPGERMIIRYGSLSMVVEDTRAAQRSIEEMVAEMADEGAYVVTSEEQGGVEGSSPHITLNIRVPATRFDEVMDRLAGQAFEVTARSESGQDVTEEYVDLQARLESLEAARQRLLEIMQSTKTTRELLEAEQQLTQREAELESIKGRMQYLAQSAQLAAIWIDLQPYLLSQLVSARWRPAESVRQAFETLVDSARSLGDFLIFFAIAILPWTVLVGLVAYGIVRLVLWRVRASRRKGAA